MRRSRVFLWFLCKMLFTRLVPVRSSGANGVDSQIYLSSIAEAPYAASLNNYIRVYPNRKRYFICTATIISPSYLLSAAHCKVERGDKVYVGTLQNEPRSYAKQRQHVIADRLAPATDYGSDIALLKVKKPLKFGLSQQAIPLFVPGDGIRADQSFKVLGYGFPNDRVRPRYRLLKSINSKVVAQSECVSRIRGKDMRDAFCARGVEAGLCQGDSGGPAVIRGRLAGIHVGSYGPANCSTRNLEVFTRVDYHYQWILGSTGEDGEFIRQLALRHRPATL